MTPIRLAGKAGARGGSRTGFEPQPSSVQWTAADVESDLPQVNRSIGWCVRGGQPWGEVDCSTHSHQTPRSLLQHDCLRLCNLPYLPACQPCVHHQTPTVSRAARKVTILWRGPGGPQERQAFSDPDARILIPRNRPPLLNTRRVWGAAHWSLTLHSSGH
ncbi:hypothetical protein BX600DRAFT_33220 [Xylariales sp. PMI_506]|nr:hypothetical protein BX600DRAFT_33220 [Xylariales sp. PMI_506]